MSQKLIKQISKLLETDWVAPTPARKNSFPLQGLPYGIGEITATLDSLLSTNVTMGEKVFRFEKKFAEDLGVKHAIMVHSGSSANLLAFSILTNPLRCRTRVVLGLSPFHHRGSNQVS